MEKADDGVNMIEVSTTSLRRRLQDRLMQRVRTSLTNFEALLSWDGQSWLKSVILLLSTTLIGYFAFFNPLGVTPDYPPYIKFFEWASTATISQATGYHAWEPGFTTLGFMLAKVLPNSGYVFLSVVLIASAFKLCLLYKLSSPVAYGLAMILFFFKFFPLQDYNQLRGAIAIGFLMLVYYQWVWKEHLWFAIFFAVCAACFHYLSMAVLPFLFLVRHRLALSRMYVVGFGLLLFVAIAAGKYIFVKYLAGVIPRLNSQTHLMDATNSYLSPVFYPEYFLIALSFIFWKDLTVNMKRVFALQIMGFAIFYGYFDHAVISIRLREVFSVFWLFYVVDYSKVVVGVRASIVVFVLLNIALGSYLFYFSDYLR